MQKEIRKSNIFEVVIMVVLLLLLVFVFGVNMLFYKDSAAPSFLGKYYVYVTNEANMDGIKKDAAVVCDSTMTENLQIQNVVLAAVNDEDDKAVLRIVGMDDSTYTLKSDYSETDDTIVIPKNNVLALCRWTSSEFGKFVTFATSNAGIVLLIVLPCTIIVLLQAMRVLDKDGKGKEKEVKNNEAYEKDRKAKEKKEKEEAKRRKLRIGNDDEPESEEADIYLIKKNKNGNAAIIPADEEEEEIKTDKNSETEVIKTVNEEEYAEVQKNVEAKIAAAEKIYNLKSEPDEVSEIPEIPVQTAEPVKNIKDIDLSAFNKPQIEHKITEPETIEDDIISEIVEETPKIEKISAPLEEPIRTEEKPEPIKKVIKAEPEIRKPAPSPAPVKKKPSSSANKYASNKYTSSAMRRSSSSKTSVDDLLKTIDSEKSKFHK